MQTKPYALISVSDKTDLKNLATNLLKSGYQILATGGTAKQLEQNNISYIKVSDFTKEPEILSGRVKTLHPKIFSGILFDRNNQEHCKQVEQSIDIVVVNFYPFYENCIKQKKEINEAIEFIDIGGPSLLRAAAKNHQHCTILFDPKDYSLVQNKIDQNIRQELAAKAFNYVLEYDQQISSYFNKKNEQITKLKYGENPHQQASLTANKNSKEFELISGSELSYNNICDLDGGYNLIKDLSPTPALCIVKHSNPCGTAQGNLSTTDLYDKALAADPISAFGGIVVTNQKINEQVAEKLSKHFFECIAAPSFEEDSLKILQKKKKLRLVKIFSFASNNKSMEIKSTFAGVLSQTPPAPLVPETEWQQVTTTKPNSKDLAELRFSMNVCKHLKSNAIAITKDGQTLGLGVGQMSRIDSTKIALQKALELGHNIAGAYVASDAFFPFSDCVELLAEHKIKSIIQPGGSIRDQESIDACNKNQISMVFCQQRFFRH
jgi:phosphoribosylaminoimidazolecarboxamide formyltransferase / IMP cyclohydrolase